jgi:hypothetical protein
MVPTTVNNFEVIAAIELDTSRVENEGEWYVVVDRNRDSRPAQYPQRYAVWNYQTYREETAAFHGFYTDSREDAILNMIQRSGFALGSISS